MSYSNAHRRAVAVEDVPKPGLSDLAFESNLRRASRPFSVTLDRGTGKRTLGAVFPTPVRDADAWESTLGDLSREQGLSPEGHSVEAARGRREEPTADPQTTTRTLQRRA